MGLIYTSVSSGKRRKKRLPTKKEQEAAQDYQKMMDKWKAVPKFGGKYGSVVKKASTPTRHRLDELTHTPVVRPSQGKLDQGSTAKPETKVYTGTKVLGIATMHKSNAVPVFSEEEAIEVSTMRRN